MRGAAAPCPFSPHHGGGNPLLHGKVTPFLICMTFIPIKNHTYGINKTFLFI
jgi:hypothetical protein